MGLHRPTKQTIAVEAKSRHRPGALGNRGTETLADELLADVGRVVGSSGRECLDDVLVINEGHLLRVLREYFAYYHDSRPHQSLEGNAPRPREIEPPSQGRIVAESQVGGLHHRYRRAA